MKSVINFLSSVGKKGEKLQEAAFFAFDDIVNYVNAVYTYCTLMPLVYTKYEGQELRDRVMNLDEKRTRAHNVAVGSCNMLNRIAELSGQEPFCPGPEASRQEVGDFCAKVVVEVFYEGSGGTSLDNLIEMLDGPLNPISRFLR